MMKAVPIKSFTPNDWLRTWTVLTCSGCGHPISINQWSDDGGTYTHFEEAETIAQVLLHTRPHRCAGKPVPAAFEEEAKAYNTIMSNQTYL